jgi:hypothetical protein
MVPDWAEIVVDPTLTPVATPAELMVATEGVDDRHVAVDVRFCVLPSLYVPVAVKPCVFPIATVGLAGVTAIDTRVGVTLRVVVPVTVPAEVVTAAEMVVLPAPTAVAKPAVLMVATAMFEESQFAEEVRF